LKTKGGKCLAMQVKFLHWNNQIEN